MKIFDKRACFLNVINVTIENNLSLTIETPNEKKTVPIPPKFSTTLWIPSNAVIRWDFGIIPSVTVNGTKRPEWSDTTTPEKVVGGFSAGDVVVFRVSG